MSDAQSKTTDLPAMLRAAADEIERLQASVASPKKAQPPRGDGSLPNSRYVEQHIPPRFQLIGNIR